MIRISKTEIDRYISSLKAKGHVIVSDKKVGRTRIIETETIRVVFKCNGWADIQNK